MSLAHRVNARDAGLRRISRMTKAAVGGGLALSGGFAALAAHGFTGQSTRVASGPTPSTTPLTVPVGSPAATAPSTAPATTAPTALAPPSTAPRSVTTRPRRTTTTTTPVYVSPNQSFTYIPAVPEAPTRHQVSSGGS